MNSIHRKSPVSVLMGISLIGFLSMNSAVAESSIQSSVYVDASDTERLQSVLNARGWDAQLDASGSLTVRHQRDRIPASRKQPPSAFQSFANALAERGWSATRDEAGNLILRPNQTIAETDNDSYVNQDKSQQATAASLPHQQWPTTLTQFSQRLASAGWATEFNHNGDMIIHLPNRQPTKHAPEARQAFQAPVQSGMDWLASRLNSSGWMTHRDNNGGLIFAHPSMHRTLVTSTNQATFSEGLNSMPIIHSGTPGGLQTISKSDDFSALRKAAENAGWRLSHAPYGGLLLIPLS